MKILSVLVILLSHVVLAGPVQLDHQTMLKGFFRDFELDSVRTMASLPKKFDESGKVITSHSRYFADSTVQTRRFIDLKNHYRLGKIQSAVLPFSGIDENNQVRSFFPRGTKIIEILAELSPYEKVQLTEQAWSGDYWATAHGGLAARYASEDFPDGEEWPVYQEFFKSFHPVDLKDKKSLNALSPAEKYDLLVGDDSFSLTMWSIGESEAVYRANGKIEPWFGLCHGWAPAAFMLERPRKAVTVEVEGQDGQSIELKFFPEDIKALSTMLWANTQNQSYFLGGRCNDKDPKKDESGRIISSACFDVNPGSFHITIANMMGVHNRNLIMDATYDYEVWNQPLHSYKLKYFNPMTRKVFENFNDAMIEMQDFSKDKFKKFRAEEAKFVVGVILELSYMSESNAKQFEKDSEAQDRIQRVLYYYDLEINSGGEIIGGEWYQNARPDFIWTTVPGAKAKTAYDRYATEKWPMAKPIPQQWKPLAGRAAQGGQPLAVIVDGLIERAK